MKRKYRKLFKVLSPVACLTAASVPLCITLTSCSQVNYGGLRSLNLAQGVQAPLSLNSSAFVKDSTDIVKYLNGDKNFHEGNYCIILASNESQSSNKFFCGGGFGGSEGLHSADYFADNAFQGSPFVGSYDLAQAFKKNVDCEVLTFFDIQTSATEVETITEGERYFPFDKKWSDSDEKKQEKWNEEHEDNKCNVIKAGEYIRNDESAKTMRWLIELCSKLFGSNFKDVGSSKMPFVMTWKKGVPQASGFGQLTDEASFKTKVIDVWEKEDEKK